MSDHEPGELDPRVLVAAGDVADETPVDWEARGAETPRLASTFERLREIEALRNAHVRLLRDEPSPPALFGWGPLRVLERLGDGSYGEVFRAWDASLQREVALKLRRAEAPVDASGTRRWLEEARRLARVRHPNVLVVYGADEHDNRAGIWTDLLRGRTLEEDLEHRGALGAREAALVGIDLCGALAAVHAAGLVHGDVTTRNVMREGSSGVADGSGRIVLMDFGSAHDRDLGPAPAFGTPIFTAPEVLRGEPRSAASDVYGLGIVLYRLVTGRYPYAADTLAQLDARITNGERTPLRAARPDLPPAFVQVVEHACEPDPSRRLSSAAEFERALAETLPRRSPAVARPTRPTRAAMFVVAAMAAAIITLFVAALLRRPFDRPGPPVPDGTAVAPGAAVAPGDVPRSASAPASGHAAAVAPQVEATLYRVTGGSREVLRTGDLVAPGDRLTLEIESRTPVHAYVLDEDEAGAVFALFPLQGRGAANPLSAGTRHRLPGREGNADLDWQVTSAGGHETILILASSEPIAAVEEVTSAVPDARPGAPIQYAAIPPQVLAKLRGVAGVARETASPPTHGASRLAALSDALSHSRAKDALWMRLIVLENPAP